MSSTPTLTREEFLANLSPVPVARSATIDKDTTCIICIADPVDVLVAVTPQGRGIIGVVDGEPPLGVETDADVVERLALLRAIGYKL